MSQQKACTVDAVHCCTALIWYANVTSVQTGDNAHGHRQELRRHAATGGWQAERFQEPLLHRNQKPLTEAHGALLEDQKSVRNTSIALNATLTGRSFRLASPAPEFASSTTSDALKGFHQKPPVQRGLKNILIPASNP
eukprot:361313-Chlamydomonas_euryale.AAC.5